jgi:tetratricopeptide (TPR) repeat protein
MDCERFDRIVLDLLYDELDELTAAAARRHLDHCSRCRGIASGLRATREVGALPLVDPPEGLELRILEAERRVREGLPLRQRLGRAVSVLAGYAMRPQLAMAALLLLAIGGSLVFFRGRPGDRDNISVTERGVPEGDSDSVAVLPLPSFAAAAEGPPEGAVIAATPKRDSSPVAGNRAPAPAAVASTEANTASEGDSAFQAALGELQSGRYQEARRQFESVAARGGADAAQASLLAARAAKSQEGCAVAAALFDQVPSRFPGTSAGYDATLEAATCYETLGDAEKARRTYQALLDVPSHSGRAKAALTQLDRVDPPVEVAARKAAAKPAAAPPANAVEQKSKAGVGTGNADGSSNAAPPADTKF